MDYGVDINFSDDPGIYQHMFLSTQRIRKMAHFVCDRSPGDSWRGRIPFPLPPLPGCLPAMSAAVSPARVPLQLVIELTEDGVIEATCASRPSAGKWPLREKRI